MFLVKTKQSEIRTSFSDTNPLIYSLLACSYEHVQCLFGGFLSLLEYICFLKMSSKPAFDVLIKELEKFGEASFKRRSVGLVEKEKALLAYKKMQLKNAGKRVTPDQERTLWKAVRSKFAAQVPKPNISMLQFLNKDELTTMEKNHLEDLTLYLKSQRVYEELLERYNPGISMKQKDKVEKTAHRVGLDVPK